MTLADPKAGRVHGRPLPQDNFQEIAMSKIEINKVAEVCKNNEVEPDKLRRIIEELNLAAQPEGGDEKVPAVKKQFVILVSDPEGVMPKQDLVGWVLQIPEDESVATTQARINRAAYDFNASKKGRLHPVSTVGEALENVTKHYTDEADLWVKTKTPVLVLRTDNEIPKTDREGNPITSAARRFVDSVSSSMQPGESVTISTPGGPSVTIDHTGIHSDTTRTAA